MAVAVQDPQVTQAQAQQLARVRAINQAVLLTSQKEWVQLANSLGSAASPNYALNTLFRFTLANTSAYLDKIRIWLHSVKVDNGSTTTAGALNRNGFYTLIGSLIVRLGNHVYRVPGGALPLLFQTFRRRGDLASFRGNQSYSNYDTDLFDAPYSVAASGNSSYTGYIDIPMAMLAMVGDPDGIMPTLSNAGVQVEFTTPSSFQGADAMVYPFGTAGTLTLDSTPGTIDVWAHVYKQITVTNTGALPPFTVGPAFVYESVPLPFYQAQTFYPFQGQQSNLILVKSIAVIDSPGDVTGEYSSASDLLKMDLMYDATTPVFESGNAQNPLINSTDGGLMNQLVDQGQAIGDQPSGVYVFDFGRGTNADYPNSQAYLNLEKFSRAGLRITYGTAPATGAQLYLLNVYLRPNFYEAQA